METKYTPGPWHLSGTYEGSYGIKTVFNDGSVPIMAGSSSEFKRVAIVDGQSEYKRGKGHELKCAERDANARLIAAAPEMAELLRELRDYVSCIPESAAGGDDVAIALARKAAALLARIDGGAE